MKKLVTLCAVAVLFTPAVSFAQDKPVLDAATCRQLMVDYQPSTDINNADYKPGVDVQGKPVVEADINPSAVTVPDVVTFPLTVDVARYAGLPRPIGTEMDAYMGMVSIDTKTNKVSYNGQVLESNAVSALKDLCAEDKADLSIKKAGSKVDILKGHSGNTDILKGSRGGKPILQGDLPAMPRPQVDIKKTGD